MERKAYLRCAASQACSRDRRNLCAPQRGTFMKRFFSILETYTAYEARCCSHRRCMLCFPACVFVVLCCLGYKMQHSCVLLRHSPSCENIFILIVGHFVLVASVFPRNILLGRNRCRIRGSLYPVAGYERRDGLPPAGPSTLSTLADRYQSVCPAKAQRVEGFAWGGLSRFS